MSVYRARDALALPSIISWTRVPLAVAFPAALRSPRAAISLLAAAAVSDVLDGWVARRYGLVTPMGAAVDPITDKLFVFSVVASLTLAKRLPIWGLILLASRDIGEAPLVLWYANRQRTRRARAGVPMANSMGKVATALQFATAAFAVVRSKHTRAFVHATAAVGTAAAIGYLARALADRRSISAE